MTTDREAQLDACIDHLRQAHLHATQARVPIVYDIANAIVALRDVLRTVQQGMETTTEKRS